MTSDEYATLMDFLATRFARIDAAFAAMDARLARMEARQEALEARQEALEARQEALETRQGALETRVGALESRQKAFEARLTRVEVLMESMRDDLRRVAEGVVAVNERLGRRFDTLDRGLAGIHVQFDRFAVDFGTVQLDHSARIEALERQRRRPDTGG